MKVVNLTRDQIKKLERLWLLFGNRGKKSTLFNHKYIQGFLEYNEDRSEIYLHGIEGLTQECINEVENIVYHDSKFNGNQNENLKQ